MGIFQKGLKEQCIQNSLTPNTEFTRLSHSPDQMQIVICPVLTNQCLINVCERIQKSNPKDNLGCNIYNTASSTSHKKGSAVCLDTDGGKFRKRRKFKQLVLHFSCGHLFSKDFCVISLVTFHMCSVIKQFGDQTHSSEIFPSAGSYNV